MFDLTVTLDILQVPQSAVGEIPHFCNQLRLLSQRDPTIVQGILNNLDPESKKFIGEIYGAKQV